MMPPSVTPSSAVPHSYGLAVGVRLEDEGSESSSAVGARMLLAKGEYQRRMPNFAEIYNQNGVAGAKSDYEKNACEEGDVLEPYFFQDATELLDELYNERDLNNMKERVFKKVKTKPVLNIDVNMLTDLSSTFSKSTGEISSWQDTVQNVRLVLLLRSGRTNTWPAGDHVSSLPVGLLSAYKETPATVSGEVPSTLARNPCIFQLSTTSSKEDGAEADDSCDPPYFLTPLDRCIQYQIETFLCRRRPQHNHNVLLQNQHFLPFAPELSSMLLFDMMKPTILTTNGPLSMAFQSLLIGKPAVYKM